MAKSRAQQAARAISMKKAGKKPKSLKKANKGLSVEKGCPPNCNTTADSTFYYADKEYKAKLKGLTANTKPEMDKQFAIMEKAKQDRYRQSKKGKPGYDKNGFPIQKTTTKNKG